MTSRLMTALIFISPLGLWAQESPVGLTLCKNKKIVRSIRVEKDLSTDQFVTYYTKSGKDREVGRARWRPSAEKYQLNIKSNLEKAGWDCQSTNEYKVTHADSK